MSKSADHNNNNLRHFYNTRYHGQAYAAGQLEDKGSYAWVRSFVSQYLLADKKCLEIGCGRGRLQDLVTDYVGIELAESAGSHLRKPFVVCSAVHLPFADSTFDAIWTVTVLEHIPNPETVLIETRRVLKPGGVLLLLPAWYCRPWASEGYPVRLYSDFDWRGKLIKASIPIRNSVVFRSMYIFPGRLMRFLQWKLTGRPTRFQHGILKPNYEHYWMSDSDAVNSMDPFEAYLWYRSRGDTCLNYPTDRQAFFVRTGGLIFRVKPNQNVTGFDES